MRVRDRVNWLVAGYRHIDTASDTGPWYKTERVIGNLLSSGGYSRSNVFITTKIHPQDHGTDPAEQSIDKSLYNLQTTYIDLMLLHYADCKSYYSSRIRSHPKQAGVTCAQET